jgi:tight adherence protein C
VTELPAIVYLFGGAGLLALAVFGLRGLLEIREALRLAEFERLAQPPHWVVTRALLGVLLAIPPVALFASQGSLSLVPGLLVAALGYWMAPHLLLAARRRVEEQILDALPLHLDMIALAMESGSSWSAALAICRERAPEGPLRRAWDRVMLEMHAGTDALEALRHLEQRLRLSPFATLVSALRAAEKLQLPAWGVLRDRARQAAAARFARAERQARVAPLKLWAAMLLCLAPCTAAVLAWPAAQLLAALFE